MTDLEKLEETLRISLNELIKQGTSLVLTKINEGGMLEIVQNPYRVEVVTEYIATSNMI